MSSQQPFKDEARVFDVLVVGAGPAGIAAVLALRELRVAWVDPNFSSGRLALWPTVPCNTKVDLLVGPGFFGHPLLAPLKQEIEPQVQRLVDQAYPLPGLEDPSSLGFTYLRDCKAVFDAVTKALLAREVAAVHGTVQSLCPGCDGWSATVGDRTGASRVVKARCVVLATGVQPRDRQTNGGGPSIHVEEAFDPERLASRLGQGQRVAVFGNSHSAAIVLANLQALRERLSLSVGNFARRPVRIAEWLPEHSTYRYTSTGLKGFGASFGQEHMARSSGSLAVLPAESFRSGDWDWVIDCTGYVPSALPGVHGQSDYGARCEATGRLGVDRGWSGLYAVGAPWPEPPGRLWGRGTQDLEGFKSETSFIGFHLFFSRAALIASEITGRLKRAPLVGGGRGDLSAEEGAPAKTRRKA